MRSRDGPTGAQGRGSGRREQLLRAGIAEFTARGYEGVSVDAVAESAGIAKGLLYYYFASKRDFYVAVVAAISQDLERATDADPALPGEEQLWWGLEANLRWAEEHPDAFRTILRGGGSDDPAIGRIVDARRASGVQRVLTGLGIEDPPPTLVVALRGWVGFFEEATLSWLADEHVTRAELLTLLTRVLHSTLRDVRAMDPHALPETALARVGNGRGRR